MGMGQLMGGMGPVRNHFDFGPMEEFAGKEKESLSQGMGGIYGRWNGLDEDLDAGQQVEIPAEQPTLIDEDLMPSSAGGPSSYDSKGGRIVGGTTIGDAESQTGSSPPPKTEEIHVVEPEHTFTRRRQRKLSNTNPNARRQGRLALFEGLGGGLTDDAAGESYTVHVHNHDALNGFSSALPTKAPRKPFPAIASGIQTGKYTDYPDGMGPPVGRERPYRFSFYSNALPATIHARSLSELPSDGQTFNDLFAGRPAGKAQPQGKDSDATSFAASRTGSGAATPVGGDAAGGPKSSLLARATTHGGADKTSKPVEDDVETQTWWLDVLSPTDEEMRMLAKVSSFAPRVGN
jgi:magnesium transporter